MGTTQVQDKQFKEIIQEEIISAISLPNSLLQIAIEYISDVMFPDDVFSDKDLQAWAEKNGYIKE